MHLISVGDTVRLEHYLRLRAAKKSVIKLHFDANDAPAPWIDGQRGAGQPRWSFRRASLLLSADFRP